MSNKPKSDYEAEDIYVLEGLEPVRKRPGMYIGSTGTDGLHHLVWEVVDNGIDEAMAGYADEVYIILHPGESVTVIDDGRGIPISEHPETKRSALETVMTTLHAGGKFGGDSYKVAGGLHGVGVSVVCALSKWLKASVIREGKVYTQSYEKGEVTSDLENLGKASEVSLGDMIDSHLFADDDEGEKRLEALKEIIPDLDTGTMVSFKPDDDTFSATEFKFKKLLEHLRQQAYLTKGLKINIIDQRNSIKPRRYSFCFEGGIKSYVRYLLWGEQPTHESIFYTRKTDEEEDVLVEVALQYSDDLEGMTVSFANNINTGDGGMHLTGFKRALTRAINEFAKAEDYIKENEDNLVGRDVREGMVAVVSVKIREPQFEGQTKAKLGNPEARSATEKILYEEFKDFLFENPSEARSIMEKVLLARKARRAAKKAKETVIRKGALTGLSLPGKLADCSSRDPEKTELFIVEGDSAGGCFSEDTEVALTDGRDLAFKDLVQEAEEGKQNYCYTVKEDGTVGIEKIKNPRITKEDVEVVRVVLDNDEEIVCTPDHKFMLRDGSYKQARNLEPDDSLCRLDENDPNLLRMDTFCDRFFEGDEEKAVEAVRNYNHKVKKIEKVTEKKDVYDIEVPETHNFALASGVFVHNSSKQARDRGYQAILPLRGKILNVEKARLNRILENKEIKSLIVALGTAVAEEFDLSEIRYNKVIIMTDADVDGAHIRTLLLTLFYRYFKPVIESGHLYIVEPPLYRIQRGKKVDYAYTEKKKEKLIKKLNKQNKRFSLQRFKGLGEMSPHQLWDTSMDPETRVLKRVTVDDAQEADRVFDDLMGKDVTPRKKFLKSRAQEVENLDI